MTKSPPPLDYETPPLASLLRPLTVALSIAAVTLVFLYVLLSIYVTHCQRIDH